jgi:hypothetical protein
LNTLIYLTVKQLLLNSLLIFGSAFLYIQCVKMLIPASKLPNHQVQSHQKAQSAGDSKQNNAAFAVTNASAFKLNFKDRVVNPVLKSPAFPYNMMAYINYHSLFYSPYLGVSYSDLVDNYNNTPPSSKR